MSRRNFARCLALRWHHNGCDGVSNHQPHDCLLNRLFRRRSKKTSKLIAIGLCVGNSPLTGEFPAQRASNAENVTIGWLHHGQSLRHCRFFINKIVNSLNIIFNITLRRLKYEIKSLTNHSQQTLYSTMTFLNEILKRVCSVDKLRN